MSFQELMMASRNARLTADRALDPSIFTSAETDPAKRTAQVKQSLEKVFHYYLGKKVPHQKIRFTIERPSTEEQAADTEEMDLTFFAERVPEAPKQLLSTQVKLLEKPIEYLLEQEEIRLSELTLTAAPPKEEEDAEMSEASAPTGEASLWAEKYTAYKYIDLLTSEEVNRQVLTWLLSWNPVVFPQKQVVSLRPPEVGGRKNPLVFQNTALSSFEEEHSYLKKRCLLLHGPPGGGKSTLARVLADKAGYCAKVVNASDIRSGADLINIVTNVLETNAFFDKTGFQKGDKKPMCLILDEVDGAFGGERQGIGQLVNFLWQCIKAAVQASKNNKTKKAVEKNDIDMDSSASEGEQGETRAEKVPKKKQSKFPPLNRPIIFVCNDGFAKVLRVLNDITLRIKVPQTDDRKIRDRLCQIVRQEEMTNFDNSLVNKIVEQSNGDLRSCINTLQFLQTNSNANKSGANLTTQKQMENLSKDQIESPYSVAEFALYGRVERVASKALRRIRDQVGKISDQSSQLQDFLFENYLDTCQFFDDTFELSAEFLDFLSLSNCQDQYCYRTVNYQMKAFQFLPAALFKLKCADGQRFNTYMQRPKQFGWVMAQDTKHIEEVAHHLLAPKSKHRSITKVDALQPADEKLNGFLQRQTLQMRTQDALKDIWPFVYQLIHPSIRDVSPALFRADEVLALRMAIELMVAFDIELKSSSSATHLPQFEPNITECVAFQGLQGSILTLRPKTQSLILQQYHRVKQEMLNGSTPEKVATPKASLVGVPSIFPVKKKRALADIPAEEEQYFTYKFKEGHSKNFKKELRLDYFK